HKAVTHQNSTTIGHSQSPRSFLRGGPLITNFARASNPRFPWYALRRAARNRSRLVRKLGQGGCGKLPVVAGALVTLILSGPGAVAGPWEDGLVAYNRGDYLPAIRLLRPLAQAGNAKAQNVMA